MTAFAVFFFLLRPGFDGPGGKPPCGSSADRREGGDPAFSLLGQKGQIRGKNETFVLWLTFEKKFTMIAFRAPGAPDKAPAAGAGKSRPVSGTQNTGFYLLF